MTGAESGRKAECAKNLCGTDILDALGFKTRNLDAHTQQLCADDKPVGVAIVLENDETPDFVMERFNTISPVDYALAKAKSENVPWVMIVHGARLRLYAAGSNPYAEKDGRQKVCLGCQPALLAEKHLSYLWLLFSSDALRKGGEPLRHHGCVVTLLLRHSLSHS